MMNYQECKKIAEIQEQLILQLKLIKFGLTFNAAFLGLIAGLVLGMRH